MQNATPTRRVSIPPATEPNGELSCPKEHAGIVVFCPEDRLVRHMHNIEIAKIFNRHGLARLLPDLPAWAQEAPSKGAAAAEYLEQATLWLHQQAGKPEAAPIGYFAVGADSTAAALGAAARHPDIVRAIVVCGGKPDDLANLLPQIKSPVLLIAGGRDPGGLRSSQRALAKLDGIAALNVIPRASQSFEEPGAMEEMAQLAALWFLQHLGP